jgi:Uma2 family endonuclease
MTQAKPRFRSIEDYLNYNDGTDTRYELVDAELVEMGAENDINQEIPFFLVSVLLQFVPHYLLRRGTEIAVSNRTLTCRVPDLIVLTEETRNAMNRDQRSLITAEMPPPRLVVEIVSPGDPGEDNYERDYIEKRRGYALRGIPEYWIIDPARSLVMVFTLNGLEYQEIGQFRGSEPITSKVFPVSLTAQQILSAGR